VDRIVLLVTSPRLPAGLLSAATWDLVRAYPVLTAAESEQTQALRAGGATVTVVPPQADQILAAAAAHTTVVWLAGPGGDEALGRELGLRLAREPGAAELELMYGSWDPAGARLLDVVSVMDRLASPGGDPWKHQQTHQTLARYLLEEAYEAYDAIDRNDLAALREELGDVLLQVVLHARMAEDADRPWTVDDVAGDLVAKLVRRNPHVFGDAQVADIDEIMENWERIKREERQSKADKPSAMDGVAVGQPALALAAKVLSRAERAGIPLSLPELPDEIRDEETLGAALFAFVVAAHLQGLDAEAALRRMALAQIDAVRDAEHPPGSEDDPIV
jgi:XTP/dITP diphosphohydrolase